MVLDNIPFIFSFSSLIMASGSEASASPETVLQAHWHEGSARQTWGDSALGLWLGDGDFLIRSCY